MVVHAGRVEAHRLTRRDADFLQTPWSLRRNLSMPRQHSEPPRRADSARQAEAGHHPRMDKPKPPLTAPSDWMAPLPVHPEKPVTPPVVSAPWVGKAKKKARKR